MKKSTITKSLFALLICAFCFSFTQAEVVHIDYGTDFVIEMEANLSLDVDNNGVNDFYINQLPGELSIKTSLGCFVRGENYGGGLSVRVMEEGEEIGDGNDDFEDFGNGRMYSDADGFAPGWKDGDYFFVGIMFFDSSTMGWMRVKIDSEAGTLMIREAAYETIPDTAVPAGEGTTFGSLQLAQLGDFGPVLNLGDEPRRINRAKTGSFTSVDVSPNPVADIANIRFENKSELATQLEVFDVSGKQMAVHKYPAGYDAVRLQMHVSDWQRGIYIVRLSNSEGLLDQTKLVIQ